MSGGNNFGAAGSRCRSAAHGVGRRVAEHRPAEQAAADDRRTDHVVGSVVPGWEWLVVALLFFGSGLTYPSVLPLDESSPEDDRPTAPYLLRIRRLPVRD